MLIAHITTDRKVADTGPNLLRSADIFGEGGAGFADRAMSSTPPQLPESDNFSENFYDHANALQQAFL